MYFKQLPEPNIEGQWEFLQLQMLGLAPRKLNDSYFVFERSGKHCLQQYS
jgi:hypothetical protein